MAAQRNAALAKLLGALFDSDELRWHLANEPHGDAVPDALPGHSASHGQLTRTAVEVLMRHGFIDREFFDRLAEVRPRRISEIRSVRAQWLSGAELARGAMWAADRYRLVEVLGSGGFGQVWKAVDQRTGRIVALKVLLEHHTDDRAIRRRFYRGASVLAELSHPSIVRLLSGVEQEGVRHYYVMEFIEGDSLDALVQRRPFPELLDYVLQIGDGLACIHAHGLLHRDIKPRNILVTPRGQAKLIDFDLVAGETFEPMTTRAIGTHFFAPPEGLQPGRRTTAYDVFGLARTVEYLLRGGIAPESSLQAPDALDAPEHLRALLRSALHPDPTARLQSVVGFCDALRTAYARPVAVQVLPETAMIEPPAPPPAPARPVGRQWSGMFAALGLAFALAAVLWNAPRLFGSAEPATLAADPEAPAVTTVRPAVDPPSRPSAAAAAPSSAVPPPAPPTIEAPASPTAEPPSSTPAPPAAAASANDEPSAKKASVVEPNLPLLIKVGPLYAPKELSPNTFRSQKEAMAHCKGLLAAKYARLTAWRLATVVEALRFRDVGSINRRTYWTREAPQAGRIKQVQLMDGRVFERAGDDSRAMGSALCVATK